MAAFQEAIDEACQTFSANLAASPSMVTWQWIWEDVVC